MQENVDWPIVLRLAMGSLPASIILLAIIAYVPLGHGGHGGVDSLWAGLRASGERAGVIVLYPIMMKTHAASSMERETAQAHVATVLFGVALGLLVTLTSVGAGAIGVVVLAMLFPALPAKRIVGTDIAHAVPLTLVAGAGHLGLGHVDFGILAALLCGSIPGILLGTRLAGVAPDWLLRPLLALTLCYAAYALLRNRSVGAANAAEATCRSGAVGVSPPATQTIGGALTAEFSDAFADACFCRSTARMRT